MTHAAKWMLLALALTACDDAGGGGDGGALDAMVDMALSCDDVICGGNATCEAGVCVCNPGLVAEGDDCVEPGPEPLPVPSDRTEAAVCAYWAQEHVDVTPEITPNDGMCAATTLEPGAQDNAVRRTNLYRWLVGLPPVAYDPELLAGVQACAVVLDALGRLDHNPPAATPCYDPIQAAGRSNLAQGGTMAGSVDLYVDDGGVDSLGHRRWVLEPTLGATAFGRKGVFSCMDVFSGGGSGQAAFIAWPPPGYVPLASAAGQWSISLWGRTVTADSVLRVGPEGGERAMVSYSALELGFGSADSVIAFDVPAELRRAGQRITVTLDRLSDGEPLEYTVAFTDCRG